MERVSLEMASVQKVLLRRNQTRTRVEIKEKSAGSDSGSCPTNLLF